MNRTCTHCPRTLHSRNISGLCRSCASKRDPSHREEAAKSAERTELQLLDNANRYFVKRLNEQFIAAADRRGIPIEDAKLLLVNGVRI